MKFPFNNQIGLPFLEQAGSLYNVSAAYHEYLSFAGKLSQI
jgi:hypothetical protein